MEEPKLAYNPYGGVGQTKNVNQMLTHPIAIPNAKYNDLTQSKMTSYSEFASWNHLDQISPYWWILLFHIIIQMVSHFDIESTEFTFWKTTKFSLVSTNERNKAENKRLFSVDKFASCQPQCVILNSKRHYKRIIRVLWRRDLLLSEVAQRAYCHLWWHCIAISRCSWCSLSFIQSRDEKLILIDWITNDMTTYAKMRIYHVIVWTIVVINRIQWWWLKRALVLLSLS